MKIQDQTRSFQANLTPASLAAGSGLLDTDPHQNALSLTFVNPTLEKHYNQAVHAAEPTLRNSVAQLGDCSNNFWCAVAGSTLIYVTSYAALSFYQDYEWLPLVWRVLALLGSTTLLAVAYVFQCGGSALWLKFAYFLHNCMLIYLEAPYRQMTQTSDKAELLSPALGLLLFMSMSRFTVFANYLQFLVVHIGLLAVYASLASVFTAAYFLPLLETLFLSVCLYSLTREMFSQELVLRSKFEAGQRKTDEPVTEIEGLLATVTIAINQVTGVLSAAPHRLKAKLLLVHESLQTVLKQATSNSLYTPKVERIAADADEEQYLNENYIAQTELPQRALSLRRRNTAGPENNDYAGLLTNLGKNWNFNTFLLADCTARPLEAAGVDAFQRYSLEAEFALEPRAVANFFGVLEDHYRPENPYHNSVHAVDVLSSFIYLVNASGLRHTTTSLETVAAIIANLAHDVGHPAFTNRFLVNSRDPLAVRYNDVSVLEMMHASLTFELLQNTQMLGGLDTDQWIYTRKLIVEMILATDMSKHFELLGQFKNKTLTSPQKSLNTPEDRLDVYRIAIKAADIGHAAKAWNLHERWSMLVIQEFFHQGDVEKAAGLSVSMLCDREATDINKSQAGFIKNIALPLYESLNAYLQAADIEAVCIMQLTANHKQWETETRPERRVSMSRDPNSLVSSFKADRHATVHI